MLGLLTIAMALAGSSDLTVKVEGSTPLTVHVDGKRVGAAAEGKALKHEVTPGIHEVAVSYDKEGTWLFCVGEIDLRKNATVEAGGRACTNIEPSVRTEATVVRGGLIQITGADAKGKVSIGDVLTMEMISHTTAIANVPVGTYDVSVGAACSGKVTVAEGTKSMVVVAGDDCRGFDTGGKKGGGKKGGGKKGGGKKGGKK
jgi:hypothetical protein